MHKIVLLLFGFLAQLELVNTQQLLANPKCNHWPDRGTCELEFNVKWYYDRYDHRCRRFFYGGCEGNENRFDSLEECSSQCSYQEPTNRDRCFQPHNPGTCNADIERWFFDMDKKQCVCSWWSGCGGNSNIYYSYNHCMLICGDYAEHGPGIDEKYWGRINNRSMSVESQNVLNDPSMYNRFSAEPYSVQVPMDIPYNPRLYSTNQDVYNDQLITINISHSDDGPRYLHSLPMVTVPLLRPKSDGVTIHRYDSEPRLLQEIPESNNNNWQIQEQAPVSNNPMKRRFKIQKKKTPPRMIHLNTNRLQQNQPYQPQPQLQQNAYKIQLDNNNNVDGNSPVNYQIVRAQDALSHHEQLSKALQDEAEETQKRIQETMRRNYYEQQQHRQQYRQPVQQQQQSANNENYHPDLVNQFKSHLEEHENALRRKLEAQFPDHIITLIPHIETVRHPDGRSVVRQKIQWTAHPKAMYNGNSLHPIAQQPHAVAPVVETTTTTTTMAPPTIPTIIETTMSNHEIARIQHEEMQKKHKEEIEKRRLETVRRREEHQKKVKEYQEKQKRERERMMAEREKEDMERRRQFEEDMKKKRIQMQMTTTQIVLTTTPEPTTVIETTAAAPVYYPTVPVRQVVYDAHVQQPIARQPISKAAAEPIDNSRPIVEHLTSAPLSLEDIIAMDNQRAEYEDDYDVPMDFPDTDAPPMTTRATIRATPRPPTQNPAPMPRAPINGGGGFSPIVSPPTGGNKKSKLFSEISSEEYVQDVDFDPYVDFVM